jgi:CxxC motif-containing protein (DUF1111 family)
MKLIKLCALLLFAAVLFLSLSFSTRVEGQNVWSEPSVSSYAEAPAGFDNETNGLVDQNTHSTVDQNNFQERDTISQGLGPVYNAQSCQECHQTPVAGGISQVTELRAGHLDGSGNFVAATVTIHDDAGNPVTIPNRSLINDRSICPGVDATQVCSDGTTFNHPTAYTQEAVSDTETIRTFRTSLNTLGDGFVEAVDGRLLEAISQIQAGLTGGRIRGQLIQVPIAEAPAGTTGVGRFGWKCQHASLLSFSGDAYLNEQGITNRLNPVDVTGICDTINDPEDTPSSTPDPITHTFLADIDRFARFMRATKAPPRDAALAATSDAQAGSNLFLALGCAICHVPTLVTVDPGTQLNGGTFTVDGNLGHKQFHPFGDFLLHNVGTGDGILQNGPPETRNKVRTAPLWGVRTRSRLMHDGASPTLTNAILRHSGEAAPMTGFFQGLSPAQKNQLLTFLKSL